MRERRYTYRSAFYFAFQRLMNRLSIKVFGDVFWQNRLTYPFRRLGCVFKGHDVAARRHPNGREKARVYILGKGYRCHRCWEQHPDPKEPKPRVVTIVKTASVVDLPRIPQETLDALQKDLQTEIDKLQTSYSGAQNLLWRGSNGTAPTDVQQALQQAIQRGKHRSKPYIGPSDIS